MPTTARRPGAAITAGWSVGSAVGEEGAPTGVGRGSRLSPIVTEHAASARTSVPATRGAVDVSLLVIAPNRTPGRADGWKLLGPSASPERRRFPGPEELCTVLEMDGTPLRHRTSAAMAATW